MKTKKFSALLLCIVIMTGMLAITASAGSAFPDVDDNASYAWAVEMTKQMGLFTGDEKGNFNPNSGITRAEFAAVVCRFMGGEEEAKALTNSGFTDVPNNHWAVGYVAWAVKNGIVNGYGNGKFGPGDQVKYEQAIKMVVCAMGYGDAAADAGGYPYGYIAVANRAGLLNDVDNTFGSIITRANIALLFANSSKSLLRE